MQNHIKIYENPDLLSHALINDIWSNSSQNNLNIALSGGSTPKRMFTIIAKEYSDKFNWKHTQFFWCDERCVNPDSEDSNFGIAKKILFDSIPVPKNNILRFFFAFYPVNEVLRYSSELSKNLPLKYNIPYFDYIILGIGEDGHTASIFPNQIEIFHSGNLCEKSQHPETKQNRITLTGKILNNARHIVFMVTGKSKSAIVNEILNCTILSSVYPASLVNPVDGELLWYLDRESASMIDSRKLSI